MQAGQPCEDQVIKDLADYKKSFDAWWFNLQPVACTKGSILQLAKDDFDWKKMNKAGKNGFVVVMLILTWWRAACDRSSTEEWERVLDHVTEVLGQVTKLPLITSTHKCHVPDNELATEDIRLSKHVSK